MRNNMEIRYLCPYWGCEAMSASEFLNRALAHGYDGVEINFPHDDQFIAEFQAACANIRSTSHPDFIVIAQNVVSPSKKGMADYTARLIDRLEMVASLQPFAINSHTGKDYYSFSENCQIIETTQQIAKKTGIPIWHEIHRGRFSFHLKTVLDYLEVFPALGLVADYSHFCVVSESTLHDQQAQLDRLTPFVKHLHARIGFEQGPQVNHPFAPEWESYRRLYLKWWKAIVAFHEKQHCSIFTVTPEFGPYPYMPSAPFTQQPLASQWDINLEMKQFLQQHL